MAKTITIGSRPRSAARRAALLLATALAACTPGPAPEAPSRAVVMTSDLPPMRQFAGHAGAPPTRPNDEIAQDFMDLAFRMESGRAVPILTRFEEPISVRVVGAAPPSLTPDLRRLIARLNAEAGIDIFLTGGPEAAITIEAIPRAELSRVAPRAACFVAPRVSSWTEYMEVRRTPTVDWTTLVRRDRATIFLPNDVAPQEIRDCLHEELAQALGPLNDLFRLNDSVFNDDNMHAVLTGFDMLVLRAYYAPDLQNGMTRGEVAARLPAVLARYNPAGQRAGEPINDTSRDWIDAVETAMAADVGVGRRRDSAERAINLARAFGWNGTRKGFALYVYGRLMVQAAPDLARGAFLEAQRVYRATPETRLHEAHVNMQLAAFALSEGDAAHVLALTDSAIPVAEGYENAALLASLMMFRAEALDMLGRGEEAEAERLDSLAWARYGFGSDQNVRARLREIAALRPAN